MPTIEWLGFLAITIMVGSYALENRHTNWIWIFAIGCLIAAVYAYLIGSYPFFIAEGVWSVIAAKRWLNARKTVRR